MIAGMEKAGVDHEALLDTYIRAINVCVQDRPEDLRVGVHMCRGNFTVGYRELGLLFWAHYGRARAVFIFVKVDITVSRRNYSMIWTWMHSM